MESRRSLAEAAIRRFLKGANKDPDVGLDTSLFADGLGLDSLETAELSAVLEDALGQDPFSEGDMPQTLTALLDFYGADNETVADAVH